MIFNFKKDEYEMLVKYVSKTMNFVTSALFYNTEVTFVIVVATLIMSRLLFLLFLCKTLLI